MFVIPEYFVGSAAVQARQGIHPRQYIVELFRQRVRASLSLQALQALPQRLFDRFRQRLTGLAGYGSRQSLGIFISNTESHTPLVYTNARLYIKLGRLKIVGYLQVIGQAQTLENKPHPISLWIPGPGFHYASCL
jgi:hypothetical protein